jgi:signal transduction histidine kinase
VPAEVQVALYRIAQEALNNMAKHAAASRATIRLGCTVDDLQGLRVELSVADDGQGFDLGHVPARGQGLSIMRERAAAAGATVQIDSQAGRGTRVRVTWCESD